MKIGQNTPYSPIPSTQAEQASPALSKAPPTRPGLAMAAYNVRSLARMMVSPASPSEVHQRRSILLGTGMTAAVILGAAMVVGAVSFPPAAPLLGLAAAGAFLLAGYIMRKGVRHEQAARLPSYMPAARPQVTRPAVNAASEREAQEAQEAVELVGAIENAEANEVLDAVEAGPMPPPEEPRLSRTSSVVSTDSFLSTNSSLSSDLQDLNRDI